MVSAVKTANQGDVIVIGRMAALNGVDRKGFWGVSN